MLDRNIDIIMLFLYYRKFRCKYSQLLKKN